MFDLFSGGGGSSLGASMAGLEIVGGAEMDPYPAAAFRMNFPNALLYECDLRELSPRAVKSDLGRIDLLLASPECTNHSCAKGSRSPFRREQEHRLGSHSVRARAAALLDNPQECCAHAALEAFPELKAALQDIGYKIRVKVLDSAAFGVPQRRRRLFMVASLTGDESLENLPTRTEKAATTILDRDGTWPTTPLFSARRARRTLEARIARTGKTGSNDPIPACLLWHRRLGGLAVARPAAEDDHDRRPVRPRTAVAARPHHANVAAERVAEGDGFSQMVSVS